jgi:hypothetical protein
LVALLTTALEDWRDVFGECDGRCGCLFSSSLRREEDYTAENGKRCPEKTDARHLAPQAKFYGWGERFVKRE